MNKAFFSALDMVKNELMGYIPTLHRHLAGREALKDVILERFRHHPSGSLIWFKNGKESSEWGYWSKSLEDFLRRKCAFLVCSLHLNHLFTHYF